MLIQYEVREAAMARARLLRARAMHRFMSRLLRRLTGAFRLLPREKPARLALKH